MIFEWFRNVLVEIFGVLKSVLFLFASFLDTIGFLSSGLRFSSLLLTQ